jgi:hypothetical protein
MLKLAGLIYTMVGYIVSGSFVVAALMLDRMDAMSIAIAAAFGALAALPVTWMIASKLDKTIRLA